MEEDAALVTIAIPTYNRAGTYLRFALESALAQTYPNLEIIVSDNCSSDNTEQVVKEYGDRVHYVRQNPALSPNKNADFCLLAASGKYFHLLHDDDLIEPDFIESCVAAFSGRDVGFVRTGANVIDGSGAMLKARPNPVIGDDLFRFYQSILEGRAVTYFCNTLYDTRYLRRIGGFQSKGFAYHDIIANMKLAHRHGWIDIEEPKAAYRIHDSKLGGVTEVTKWCEDSVQIVNLMCELLPKHASYFAREGMKIMCRRNVAKVNRLTGLTKAFRAYGVILSWYSYRDFPFRLLCSKIRNSCLAGSSQTVHGDYA